MDSTNLFFAAVNRVGNEPVRKISPSGEVTTPAGTGGLCHRDGPGGEALFHYPMDLAVDDEGNV
jgi:hypothetical protein